MGHQPRMGHWVVPFFPHGHFSGENCSAITAIFAGRKLRLKLLGAGRFQASRRLMGMGQSMPTMWCPSSFKKLGLMVDISS